MCSTYSGSYVSSTRIGYRSRLSVQVVQLSPVGFQFPSSSPSFARQDKRQRQIVKPSAPYESIIYPVQRKSKKQWLYASTRQQAKDTKTRHLFLAICLSCLVGLALDWSWIKKRKPKRQDIVLFFVLFRHKRPRQDKTRRKTPQLNFVLPLMRPSQFIVSCSS